MAECGHDQFIFLGRMMRDGSVSSLPVAYCTGCGALAKAYGFVTEGGMRKMCGFDRNQPPFPFDQWQWIKPRSPEMEEL